MEFYNDLRLAVEDFFSFYGPIHYGPYELITNRDYSFVHYEDNLAWMFDFNRNAITFMTKVCPYSTIDFVLFYMSRKHIVPNEYRLTKVENIYILKKDSHFQKKENVTNIIVKDINIFKCENPHASVHMFNFNIEKLDNLFNPSNTKEENKPIDNFDDLLGVC